MANHDLPPFELRHNRNTILHEGNPPDQNHLVLIRLSWCGVHCLFHKIIDDFLRQEGGLNRHGIPVRSQHHLQIAFHLFYQRWHATSSTACVFGEDSSSSWPKASWFRHVRMYVRQKPRPWAKMAMSSPHRSRRAVRTRGEKLEPVSCELWGVGAGSWELWNRELKAGSCELELGAVRTEGWEQCQRSFRGTEEQSRPSTNFKGTEAQRNRTNFQRTMRGTKEQRDPSKNLQRTGEQRNRENFQRTSQKFSTNL